MKVILLCIMNAQKISNFANVKSNRYGATTV